jgi:hypothetical protein
MKHLSAILMLAALCCGTAFAVKRTHGVLVGTVERLDAGARMVVVRLADGTEHTLHFLKSTAVHGMEDTGAAAKDTFHGLKEGSQVVVHYTAEGSEETADEVDNIGKDGLKVSEGTVTQINRGAKTLAVKTADGSEQTYRLTDNAARDAGQDISAGVGKSTKVTVYYTEQSGHKVAHFFKKAF